MMRRLLLAPLLVALTLAACGDDGPTEPPVPAVSGSWSGTISGATFTLTLSESDDGDISGSGNLSTSSDAIALTVTGTHAHPSVSLVMAATGFQDMNFQGEFSGDNRIIGTLNGSGFNNDGLTLNRQ